MKKKFKDIELIIKNELRITFNAIKTIETKTKIVDLDQQLIGRLSRMDSIIDKEMSVAKLERQKLRLNQLEEALKNLENARIQNFTISQLFLHNIKNLSALLST